MASPEQLFRLPLALCQSRNVHRGIPQLTGIVSFISALHARTKGLGEIGYCNIVVQYPCALKSFLLSSPVLKGEAAVDNELERVSKRVVGAGESLDR